MIVDPTMRSVESVEELEHSPTMIYKTSPNYSSLLTIIKPKKVLNFSLNEELFMSAYETRCEYAEFFTHSPRNLDNKGNKIFDKFQVGYEAMTQAYMVSQEFPMKRELQFMVEAVIESGLRKYWKSQADEVKTKEVIKKEKNFMLFGDMIFPFEVLLGGIFLGGFILICEIIWQKIQIKRLKRVRAIGRRVRENIEMMEIQKVKILI